MAADPQSTHESHGVWHWIALGAAVLAFAFLLTSPPARALLDVVVGWAQGVIEQYPLAGALVFFVMSAVAAMMAFVSSAVLVPAAILAWGRVFTFLLLWAGWVAGAAIAYAIGHFARPLLIRMGYGQKLAHYHGLASRRLPFWAVALFCLAVPSEIPGYLFGGIHYPFWKFLGAIALAEGIYAAGIVLAGESLVSADPLALLLTAVVLVAIAGGATLVLRALRRHNTI
jgi:uncharacterized membrane protein YdjX (TVP38/TMEM64 family)